MGGRSPTGSWPARSRWWSPCCSRPTSSNSKAESLPYGSRERSIATAITGPLATVTRWLQLDRPREAIDWALGHDDRGASGDPFALDPAPTTTSPEPSTQGGNGNGNGNGNGGGGPSNREPAPLPRPTRADPLRALVIGDSIAGDFGDTLYRIGDWYGVMKQAGPVDYEIATGLTRPDVFDWPGELRGALADRDPHVVVLALGLNDDQPMTSPSGEYLPEDSEPWQREYRRRVGAMMDIAIRAGATVAYVTPPVSSNEKRNQTYDLIRRLIALEAKERDEAVFVDAYRLFLHEGRYARYLPDKDGKLVEMRTEDGIHFTEAGSQLLAREVWRSLGQLYRLPGNAAQSGSAKGE